ncbi:tryptophan 7-halogenase [Sphingomonas rhizophila]|uniref:Tryptophan 7-halogenase n=1 Tax=Sphingomonas rhizophila TaxID=2071607 RepID=A0A7G9SBC6_9SPHN|nr:tryptophan 7-halogenase [Sphingomonas rhizophila]
MTDRVRRLVVVGRDIPLWLSAIGLQSALGRADLEVRVVELPSYLQPTDALAAVPSIVALHRTLGISDAVLPRLCGAVPMVGQRFANWSGGAPPFVLGFDTEPPGDGDIPFAQYWAKGRLEGLRVPLEDFSLGSVAARQGRVPGLSDETSGPLNAGFGYHLEAGPYAAVLHRFGQQAGIPSTFTNGVTVEREGDRIVAVVTAEGERIEGDLFIDASGPDAVLSSPQHDDFEDWSRWLPCDRILTASAAQLPNPPAYSQVSAFAQGGSACIRSLGEPGSWPLSRPRISTNGALPNSCRR